MPRAARAVAVVVVAALLAGCAGRLVLAQVPDTWLRNGWERDSSRSEASPTSENLGLVQRQTLAYVDRASSSGGYPASLALTTLKLFPTPGESQLRDILQEQVRRRSEEGGIRLGPQTVQGGRTLADGHTTLFFVFTGTVTGSGPVFTTRDATAKIVGEVWNCPEGGTSVAAVGLAQISSSSTVGGVPLPGQENDRNWRELAADPRGSIEGKVGPDGLLYNVVCRA